MLKTSASVLSELVRMRMRVRLISLCVMRMYLMSYSSYAFVCMSAYALIEKSIAIASIFMCSLFTCCRFGSRWFKSVFSCKTCMVAELVLIDNDNERPSDLALKYSCC